MFEQTFKNIDDVLWKEAGCTTELDYTEQTSWILFLKYLDDLEQERALLAELEGKTYAFIIDPRTAGQSGRRRRPRTGLSTITTR
jgi:type I restriction enzyme M protein